MIGNDKPYDVMCYTNGLVIQILSQLKYVLKGGTIGWKKVP